METIETFRNKQESDALFKLREGESPILKFVEIGKANRINSAFQGGLITKLRGVFDYMGWEWGKATCDYIEDYQTTCQFPHGAREMLLEAIQFDRLAAHDRGKTQLTFNSVDGKK